MSNGDHIPHRPPTGAAGPKRLGKYELIALIGEGGMAEVYLARQRGPMNFEKIVVVKTIHPHLARKEKFIKMLLDEARIAALLKHPSVVDIYDLGVEQGTYFIAMEHLAGEPLLAVLRAGVKKRALDIPSTARIISDVADGLHAAHDLHDVGGRPLELVHRDITPGNIIVLYTGQVKIVDFGIAKARGRLADETDVDHFKGKLGYVAPEQVQGDGTVIDRRADIFSLGVVMWEALALRRLFRTDNPAAAADAILRKDLPPPSKYRSSVPPRLDSICMRALARDRDERYATAAELHEDIEKFLAAGSFRPHKATIRAYMQEMFAGHIKDREDLLRQVADATTELHPALPSRDEEQRSAEHDLPGGHMFTGPVPLLDQAPLDERTPSGAGQKVGTAATAAPMRAASHMAPAYSAQAAAARRKRNLLLGAIAGTTLLAIIIAAAAGSDSARDETRQAAIDTAGQGGVNLAEKTPPVPVTLVHARIPEDAGVADSAAADSGAVEFDIQIPVDGGAAVELDTPELDASTDPDKTPDKKPDKKPDRKPTGDPKQLYSDGVKLYASGKLAPALSKFRSAIALKPGYADPYRGMGLVYQTQGNKKKAISSYRKYLELAPRARDRQSIEKKLKALGG